MEIKRTIYLAEKEMESMISEAENDSEDKPTALHMPVYNLLCKRML